MTGAVTGTSAPTVALGSASVSDSQVFLGVAVRNANDGLNREDGNKDVYPSGRAVTVRNMGSIVVEVADLSAVDVATNVYVALEESRGGVFVASDDSGSKRSVGQSFYMEKPPEQDSGDNLAVVTLIGGVY